MVGDGEVGVDVQLANCGHRLCICFHKPNPTRHTHHRAESAVCMSKHILTQDENIAKLALEQYLRTNWQMSKGFDAGILEAWLKK